MCSAAKSASAQKVALRPAFFSGTALRQSAKTVAPRAARSGVYAAATTSGERELWYPGATAPEHLDGSYVTLLANTPCG